MIFYIHTPTNDPFSTQFDSSLRIYVSAHEVVSIPSASRVILLITSMFLLLRVPPFYTQLDRRHETTIVRKSVKN